jgi:hypothetical protein
MLRKPILVKYLLHYIILVSQRCKYFTAWVLSDLVHNASGLGFNGYDDDDKQKSKPKWDLCTNVNIFKLEVNFFESLS